ncbi:MAG: FprA family A-type flavoprotein [Candidatus Eisenbacteria sp.]|nr:FprA family A-type flavoprotein [Candidatus Eisenbacteria bacterium]
MGNAFQATKVSERIYWVGAIDWGLRDFHGYATSRGTTYNAYLILDDRITLIDTVKAQFRDEMLSRIASVIDPSEIRCVISNHAEMDHTGCLPEVIAAVRPETVLASAQGRKALIRHFHWDREIAIAGDGERLSLGDLTLRFTSTPMLHWPDSMFTYVEEEGVLFSNDAFGMHLATSERFVDEVEPAIWRAEAAKYYANILLPFSSLVTKLLARLPQLDYDLKVIATDHGPIWRHEPQQILRLYEQWALQQPTRKAVVVYDTMWKSTEQMARAVGEGLAAVGMTVHQMPLSGTYRSDVATELLQAGAFLVGSPTINGQIFPTVADVLTYLKGLKPQNLIGGAFGSYGWSGEAVAQLEDHLREMKISLADEGVRVQYVPDAEALAQCRSLGTAVGSRLGEQLVAVS